MSGQVALQALQFYSNNYGAKRQRTPKWLRFVVYIYERARESCRFVFLCQTVFVLSL